MGGIDENFGLTPKTANVLYNTFGITNKEELKNQIKTKLSEMLSNGEISEKEEKAALKFLNSGKIGDVLIARNVAKSVAEGQIELQDNKAAEIMRNSELTIDDLYNIIGKYVDKDWTLSYTHLSKSEKKQANEGEITSSELKNIQNSLNEIIKNKGVEYQLSTKEVKHLVKALGIPIESTLRFGKILLSVLTLGAISTLSGSTMERFEHSPAEAVFSSGKSTAGATLGTGTAVKALTSLTETNFKLGIGTGIIGALTGFAIQVLRDIFRHEKSYGSQENNTGSVSNKTETMMRKMEELAVLENNIKSENE